MSEPKLRQSYGTNKTRMECWVPTYIKELLEAKAEEKGVTLSLYVVAIFRTNPEPDDLYLR